MNDTHEAHAADPRAQAEELYNVFRDARLNMHYYGAKLARLQRTSLIMEIIVAVSASAAVASASAGMGWHWLSITLGLLAAVGAVILPILRIPNRVEQTSKLWSGYTEVFLAADRLTTRLKRYQTIDESTVQAIEDIHDRMDTLCKADEPCADVKQLAAIKTRVHGEFPPENFWYPAVA